MEFKKEELIKSPLNYTGGKFKLLPQILPLFPNDIDTFVDLFGGGFNVGINVKANNIIYNDINFQVKNLLEYFKRRKSEELIKDINMLIEKYDLSNTSENGYEYYNSNSSDGVAKYNKDKYIKIRNEFNKTKDDYLLLFLVIIFSFSNQIRFNSKGEFNVAVNKRDFNNNIKKNTEVFVDKLNNINVTFFSKDFIELKIDRLKQSDLIYCDPPYLVTCATYNERDGWNIDKEIKLLNLLDSLNGKGIKFALSNVLENKGKSNDILKDWCKKYNVHYLNRTYGNCNYHAKDKSGDSTVEVLITNY